MSTILQAPGFAVEGERGRRSMRDGGKIKTRRIAFKTGLNKWKNCRKQGSTTAEEAASDAWLRCCNSPRVWARWLSGLCLNTFSGTILFFLNHSKIPLFCTR